MIDRNRDGLVTGSIPSIASKSTLVGAGTDYERPVYSPSSVNDIDETTGIENSSCG